MKEFAQLRAVQGALLNETPEIAVEYSRAIGVDKRAQNVHPVRAGYSENLEARE